MEIVFTVGFIKVVFICHYVIKMNKIYNKHKLQLFQKPIEDSFFFFFWLRIILTSRLYYAKIIKFYVQMRITKTTEYTVYRTKVLLMIFSFVYSN